MKKATKKVTLGDLRIEDLREQNISIISGIENRIKVAASCTAAGGGNCGTAGGGGGA